MRTAFIAAIAVVTALTVVWSVHVITPASSGLSEPSTASSSIGVMGMMTNAKNLPNEQYDAQ